jgi:hypothetical protein
MWVVALAPDSILWSVALMRDVQLALGMVALVFLVVTLESRPAAIVWNASRAVGILVFNFMMRPVLGWLQLLGLAVYGVLWVSPGGRRALPHRLMVVVVVLLVALGTDLIGSMLGHRVIHFFDAADYIREQYFENQQYLDRYYSGNSQYALNQFRGGLLEPVAVVASLVRGTLQPSPLWVITVGNFSTVVWFLPAIAWYLVVPFAVLGIFLVPRAAGRAGVLVACVVVATYVAGTAGLGAALEPIRARVPVLPLVQVLAAYAFIRWREGALATPGRLWLVAYTGAVAIGGLHYLVWSARGSLRGMVLAVMLGALTALAVHWARWWLVRGLRT